MNSASYCAYSSTTKLAILLGTIAVIAIGCGEQSDQPSTTKNIFGTDERTVVPEQFTAITTNAQFTERTQAAVNTTATVTTTTAVDGNLKFAEKVLKKGCLVRPFLSLRH